MKAILVFFLAAVPALFSGQLLAATAEQNYKVFCWQCHGMQGDGMGVNIPDMSTQPRDHTDTKSMKTRTDQELFDVIKGGGPALTKSILMPPWEGTLTDDEIRDMISYLRKLCKCE